MKTCPWCAGHGTDFDDKGWNLIPCPACAGTGQVEDVEPVADLTPPAPGAPCTTCRGRGTDPAPAPRVWDWSKLLCPACNGRGTRTGRALKTPLDALAPLAGRVGLVTAGVAFGLLVAVLALR